MIFTTPLFKKRGTAVKNKKIRYPLPDVMRGFALVNMIIYHTLWNAVYIFDADIPLYNGKLGKVWQICICITFIVLSGFCSRFGGKNKIRRGIVVLTAGLIVSAVTICVMPKTDVIYFGVLTLIGSCMLITTLTEKGMLRINACAGLFVCLFLFILTLKVPDGMICLFGIKITAFPAGMYKNLFTAYFGFPPKTFASSDYFPLIPWVFAYFSGFFLFEIVNRKGLTKYLSAVKSKPLQWLGKHSLLIYLLHQPVIYGIMYVLNPQ